MNKKKEIEVKEVGMEGTDLYVTDLRSGVEPDMEPDMRFPLSDTIDDNKKEAKSPIDKSFKKQIKKENKLKHMYSIYNKLKIKLGIKSKPISEPSIFTGIAVVLLKTLDFMVNAVLIVFLVYSAYLGVLAINNGAAPLNVVAICIFILTLSWVLERIKG